MASITNDPGGRKRIQFVDASGNRKTIRLGIASKKQADNFRVRVEQLTAAGGAVDEDTAKWVASLEPKWRKKLERVGLVRVAEKTARTLEGLMGAIFAAATVKKSTETTYRQTETSLYQHFGKRTALSAMTPMAAEEWRQGMVKSGLATATISKRVKTARSFFKRAIRWKLISENPFSDVRTGGERNPNRLRFISRDVADKILAACPNIQWRVLFALSRYGGLRCPSEHLALTWEDVNWSAGRIVVHENKTKTRIVPLFPELHAVLLEAFEQAEPGAKWVVTVGRRSSMNFRTNLKRIIARAGATVWPRLFHNLRATRQTELVETFPAHVVCAWIGNSERVAQDHYLQVRDEHFETAIKAAHKTAQQPAAMECNTMQPETPKPALRIKNPLSGEESGRGVTLTGLEHPGTSSGKTLPDAQSGAQTASPLADFERMELALAVLRSQRVILRHLAHRRRPAPAEGLVSK